MEPLIAYNVLESIRLLTQAMEMFRNRCVRGITANPERCQELVDGSIGIITAVNPYIGYENATRIAKAALESGRGVLELIREEGLMSEEALEAVLSPANMIRPQRRRTDEILATPGA